MSVLLGILSGLLGLGKWALKALGALLGGLTRWVGADIRHAVIAGLVAVIGALVIFTIPGLRADLASQTARADREAQNADDWMASAEGWESEFHAFVDEVIDPRDTRAMIYRGLEMSQNKVVERPWRRNGVRPV